LKGKIMEIVDMGTLMRVSVDCGLSFAVSITRESCVDMDLSIDKEVFLVFKAQNVNLFE
jgi:molybdopterin-binding protein